jgi:hypothetical protein
LNDFLTVEHNVDGTLKETRLGWINAADYGIIPNRGPVDAVNNTAGLAAAIAASNNADGSIRPIYFGAGSYCFNTGTVITTRGHRFIGVRAGRSGTDLGTTFSLRGTPGPLFQIGTDNGHAWDANEYSGPPNTEFIDIFFTTNAGTSTALSNGQGIYYPGTYVVQAWKAGSVCFVRCWVQSFEFGFWGIQSDFCEFNWKLFSCRIGIYLGPRSDQANILWLYACECDTDVWIDGAHGTTFHKYVSVGGGSSTTYPLIIGSAWARGSHNTKLINPWFEQQQGYSGIRAFIGICPHLAPGGPGVGNTYYSDTYSGNTINIDTPCVLIGPYGNATSTSQYFLEMGNNADRVSISNIGGPGVLNFNKHISYINNATGSVGAFGHYDYALTSVQNGTAPPAVSQQVYGYRQQYVYSSLGRFSILMADRTTSSRDFWMESDTSNTINGPYFRVGFPNGSTGWSSGNATKLLLAARFVDGTAAPIALAWNKGDFVRNISPSVLGSAGSQYILFGWVCTVAGTPGTWVEQRMLTGT